MRKLCITMLLLCCTITYNTESTAHHSSTHSLTHTSLTPKAVSFEAHLLEMHQSCRLQDKGLDYEVFKYAMVGYYNLIRTNQIVSNKKVITVIDYRKACTKKRLWVIDLANRNVLHHTYVAHGTASGTLFAQAFSNTPASHQSSLGFFKTSETYNGRYGYSLKLDGLEARFNSKARSRGIVIHGAHYMGESTVTGRAKVGRSHGCPAVPLAENSRIIGDIRGGNCLFAFHDQLHYLNGSDYLNYYKASTFFQKRYAL